jgi:ribosome recycling factor
MYNLDLHKPEFEKTLSHLRSELTAMQTGRATPALLQNITVVAYGVPNSLEQLASLSTPEANQLLLEPWDKSIIKDIEKALREGSQNLGIVNEGTQIRITVPQMTEETRTEIVKVVRNKLEEARIVVRAVRDKVKEEIVKEEKVKQITEDDKFKSLQDLDELTKEYNDKIKSIGESKEAELKV